MLVQDIMHKPTFVDPDTTVEAVAEIMAYKDIGSVVVGTSDKPLGIFSERDILKKIVAKGISPKRALVGEYMTSPIVAIAEGKTVVDAMKVMTERHIKRLPVVSGKKVIGMLTTRTVMENMGRSIIKQQTYSPEFEFREQMPGYW